jgi:DNA-binding MarR family transcriptional regulator
LEPISYDELLGSAGMSGFLSFLNVKAPAAGVPTLPPEREHSEDTVLAEHTVSSQSEPKIQDSEDTVLCEDTVSSQISLKPRDTVSSENEALGSTVSSEHTVSSEQLLGVGAASADTVLSKDTVSSEMHRGRRKYGAERNLKRIQRALTVQDGHTIAEQLLYQALWSARESRRETDDTRVICGGFDRLAEMTNLHWSTVKRNLRGLEQKLALETIADEDCNARLGRTYRIFSYSAILKRRRAAGMEWVFRGRVVEFVPPPPGAAAISEDTVCSEDTVSSEHTGTVCSEHTVTVSSEDTDTVCSEHTPLGNIRNTTRNTSSSNIPFLVEIARQYAPGTDDDALRTLIQNCRKRQSDATEEEIAHFIHLKGELARSLTTVKNPLGFLLESVPKCFEGESFRRFREGRVAVRQEAEEEKQYWERFLAEQRAILNDPAASEEDRAFARKLLGEDSGEGKC